MSGPTPPDSPSSGLPPEVPEEFAAAYRAAYERALAAQSDGPGHRSVAEPDETDEDALPRRRGPARVGTHRTRPAGPDGPGPESRPSSPTRRESAFEDEPSGPATAYERIRDSRWFVPLLLGLLAALLVLGAYAVGRAFSARVGEDRGGSSSSVVVGEDRWSVTARG